MKTKLNHTLRSALLCVNAFLMLALMFSIKANAQAGPPPNGLCSTAISINCGESLDGTTTGSTPTSIYFGVPIESLTGSGVWYKWTGTGDIATFEICGGSTNFHPYFFIFSGSCSGFTLIDISGYTCSSLGLGWTLVLNSVASTEYYIFV